MKTFKLVRNLFSLLLTTIWLVFCAINLVVRWPYIRQGARDSWNVSSFLSGALDSTNGGVAFQGAAQDAGGALRLALGQKADNNFVMTRSANGQLIYLDFYPYVSYDFSQQALQLRQVQLAAQEEGAPFLYLNAIDPYIEGLEYGPLPAANRNTRANALLDVLNGYGVNTLDARTVLDQSALSPGEYRYDTSSYWTTQASFEVYRALVAALKDQGVALDPGKFYTDAANFRHIEYPNSYVGEMGKRMGIPMAGYEDFTVIEPNFETSYTVDYRSTSHRATRRGAFSEALLDAYWIENEDPYLRNMYAAYLSGEYPLRIIRNEANPDGPKILVVGDAYMLPVVSFLSTTASEIHLLWPYTLPGTGTLVDYLQGGGFNGVVVGMAPNQLYGSGFNYLNGIVAEHPSSVG